MNKYQLVIFDCDGTLVDTEHLIAFAASEALKDLGYHSYTPEKCLDMFHARSVEDVIKYFINAYNNFPSEEFLSLAEKETIEIYKNKMCAYDDTHNILEFLHDIKVPICVASNGSQTIVKNALERSDLMKYFNDDAIFTYDLIGSAKPEPDLFLTAAKHFGVKPENALVIEDSGIGVEAANRAGIDVLLIDRIDTGRVISGKVLKTIHSMKQIEEFFV